MTAKGEAAMNAILRASLQEVMGPDYVRTARAPRVGGRPALPPAAGPPGAANVLRANCPAHYTLPPIGGIGHSSACK